MSDRIVLLNENYRTGNETAAGAMVNGCVFTSRDMGYDWPESFTYAVVVGWNDEDGEDGDAAMREQAAKWGWDDELIAFIRDAHERFQMLAERVGE